MLKIAFIPAFIAAAALTGWGLWPDSVSSEPASQAQQDKQNVVVVLPQTTASGPKCASCGDARHPTKLLTTDEFTQLINDFAHAELAQGEAIDALCYYGPQSLTRLNSLTNSPLDAEHNQFLRNELATRHVKFSVRVIDANGVTRVVLDRHIVEIDQRGHHHSQAFGLTAPEVSGTIKRTGLHHIWARF